MQRYPSVLDLGAIPWRDVGLAALQTFILYWVTMAGLKLVGRRAFGELGPQDIVLLLLLSEAFSVGLMPQQGGFWASLTSGVTLLTVVAVTERVPLLRRLLDSRPVDVVTRGRERREAMERFYVDAGDLEKLAREYGVPDAGAFERIVIEGDGKLTGVLKPEHRPAGSASLRDERSTSG